jgi:mRNA deadenylase 3'-5' endonuclease subunit Ccr4
MDITVTTWNVLADAYVHGQSSAMAAPEQMKWKYRFDLISKVISYLNTDIFCLQEVDNYSSSFKQLFHSLFYHSIYVRRPRKNDGCVVAFKSELFELIETEEIQLDDLKYLDPQNDGRNRFAKQNVAVLVKLAEKTSGKIIIVCTGHIHWNPNLPDVKLAQVQYTIDRIIKFKGLGDHPVLFAGDFNSLPSTDIYKLLTGLEVEVDISTPESFKQSSTTSDIYGPNTKFLCDASLAKLCKWLRVLGVDVAMDNWATNNSKGKPVLDTISAYFERATKEKRVILTTSRMLR